jgi:hypothetical protein
MRRYAHILQILCLAIGSLWMLAGLIDFVRWGGRHLLADTTGSALRLLRVPLAFIEYPEKELIALCIIAAGSVVAVSSVGAATPKLASRLVLGLAFLVSIFTIVSKTLVCLFSADGDIAQWHHLCVATGFLVLVLSLATFLKTPAISR